LLCRRDESARRAYGQAILDQMTAGGGEVTAWLKYSPDLFISAGYYEDGFDWDYDALHALSTLADSCTLVIQLPEGVVGTVRAARDFYHRIPLGDDYGATVDKDEYELTPDDQGQVSLYLERDPNRGNQQATYFLTWGENSRFRYVFRVNLCDISEEMDFTGYTGRVYAKGKWAKIHWAASLTPYIYDENGAEYLSIDACAPDGGNWDDVPYYLPFAQKPDIPDALHLFLSGEIGGGWPDLYEITLVDGKITAIRENEITEKDFSPYTGMLYGQEMRGPIEVNGKDYLVLDGYRIPLEEARATELKEQLSSLSDTGVPGLYEVTVADGEVTTIRAF